LIFKQIARNAKICGWHFAFCMAAVSGVPSSIFLLNYNIQIIIISQYDTSESDIYMDNTIELEKRFAAAFGSAMHAFHNLAARVIKTGAIPLAQYRLLMIVRETGPMTISDLTRMLGTAQSTSSELVARTVDAKLLVKFRDDQDRRVTRFRLTKKAQSLLDKRQREMDVIYRSTLDGLTTEEQRCLVEAFETISRLLKVDHK
jgi:DNA-binding MarR family transcriptional regulator